VLFVTPYPLRATLMKKHFAILTVFLFFFLGHNLAQTVYITKTGEKYHQQHCKHLAKSSIEIDLSKAASLGYAPCKVCKPIGSSTSYTPAKTGESSKTEKPAANTQCTGTTKAGERCKRMTMNPSGRCYQHEENKVDP
jgi:hypothetical protein